LTIKSNKILSISTIFDPKHCIDLNARKNSSQTSINILPHKCALICKHSASAHLVLSDGRPIGRPFQPQNGFLYFCHATGRASAPSAASAAAAAAACMHRSLLLLHAFLVLNHPSSSRAAAFALRAWVAGRVGGRRRKYSFIKTLVARRSEFQVRKSRRVLGLLHAPVRQTNAENAGQTDRQTRTHALFLFSSPSRFLHLPGIFSEPALNCGMTSWLWLLLLTAV
jgi:hypothetical protein